MIKSVNEKGSATLILTVGILIITLTIIGGSFFIRNSSTKLSSKQVISQSDLSINNPPSLFPSSTVIPFPKPSSQTFVRSENMLTPDESISEIKELCVSENYSDVALNSLHRSGESYLPISRNELYSNIDENRIHNYITVASNLCSNINSSAKLEKTQISSEKWLYRYVFSKYNSIGHSLILDNDEWKFELDLGVRF